MNNENSICINIQFDVPFMRIKPFADRIGVSETTVNNMINQGLVVLRKLKKAEIKEDGTVKYVDGKKTTVLIDLPATVVRLATMQQ
ncbi:hypothetical protein HYE54_03495 [Aggregatibacter actinomycetemcomitans]|uniref:hypothetical protein n=1 Tax=Aggregatibacter actinomycetemcomitans TaxID=714 RepID=UPI00197BF10D|nr:hypothetical protein [Aggregatibacter actinomycetemcomitans]MBN6067850.1 hypothetical protein [Aggregatibacter actinomycetemcomitans]MBN6085787.1 hypothetical protein [Aggregatibacter actinomycetemcomitans]